MEADLAPNAKAEEALHASVHAEALELVRNTIDEVSDHGVTAKAQNWFNSLVLLVAMQLPPPVIAAVAEFERDLLIERTQAGLALAKASGKTIGRPQSLDKGQVAMVRQKLSEGHSVASLAREFGTSRQTVMRVRDSVAA